MAKTWVLDTDTKGTGAQMVPLEKVLREPEPKEEPDRRPRKRQASPGSPPKRRARARRETKSTPLGSGQVRKKATGEIGRVRSVDAKAGTATVHWLRDGRTSTLPLSALSRS